MGVETLEASVEQQPSAGAMLRSRRKGLGLSQSELAQALGVTANTVARWERGELRIGKRRGLDAALTEFEVAGVAQYVAAVPRSTDARQTTLTVGDAQASWDSLPVQLTSFVGREPETDEIQELLAANRLVTLTGVGGIGKTRLALRVAEQVRQRFAHGAVFVPLAPVTDPGLVASGIAQALHVPEPGTGSLLSLLQDRLRDRCLLLILDNFEHLLPAAPIITALLSTCAHVRVLVTSRASLRVSGERVYRVPFLAVPATGALPSAKDASAYSAIQLFLERVQAARSGFVLTETDTQPVVDLCRRLDGLPLAIELAARVPLLSPQAMLERLGRRLDLLVAGARDAPQRHQTLRAAIDWSYELLGPAEQRVFRRLGVFSGGCTLEAAQAGCTPESSAEVLRCLGVLADQGLVQSGDQADGQPRFWLLETIREYALEQLVLAGEEHDTRHRHAMYYLELAEELGDEERAWGADGRQSLDRLEQELDNLRAALRWLIDQNSHAEAARLAIAQFWFWEQRTRYAEGGRWLTEILAHPASQARSITRGMLLWAKAILTTRQGALERSKQLSEEALAIARECGDRLLLARALFAESAIDASSGRIASGRQTGEEALAAYRGLRLGHPRVVNILACLGEYAWMEGDYTRSCAFATEAVTLACRTNARAGEAHARLILGRAKLGLGDLSGAQRCLEEGLQLARQAGLHWQIGFGLEFLARVALRQRDLAQAEQLFRESVRVSQRTDDRRCLIPCLEGLATVAVHRDQIERALHLAGASGALREALGAQGYRQLQRQELLGLLDRASLVLGQSRAKQAWDAGRDLPVQQAILLALEEPEPKPGAPKDITRDCGVTPREQEVLRLVAAGHSNTEIAAALTLSVRTVERHLANAYRKIGARGRADATAYTLRRGWL